MSPSPESCDSGGESTPDDVGMNLAERNQRHADPEFTQECRPVALDGGFGIVPGESKIQCALPVGLRESSSACGKSMREPGKLAQARDAENVDFIPGGPIRHAIMLTEARRGR